MRLISDGDKELIERARQFCKHGGTYSACELLDEVLANMKRLEVEQPNPEPRLAPISDAERRKLYPERNPASLNPFMCQCRGSVKRFKYHTPNECGVSSPYAIFYEEGEEVPEPVEVTPKLVALRELLSGGNLREATEAELKEQGETLARNYKPGLLQARML